MGVKILDIISLYDFMKAFGKANVGQLTFCFAKKMTQSATAYWCHHFIKGNDNTIV